MPVQRDGLYSWPEDLIYDGIRQDASESVRRYRNIENMNWRIRGAITKDLGTRFLSDTAIGSGDYETVTGFDAHFDDGTQKVIVVNGIAGPGQRVYIYNTSTDAFVQESSPTLHATNRPCAFMFADKLIIVDGNAINAMTAGEVWSTPGSTYDNPCRFGGVYANRAIYAGNPTYPYTFFPGAVLDEETLDVSHSVDVTGSYGQEITFMGPCGRFWMVGTRHLTRAYYLGLGGPKDWDFDDVSAMVGGVSWESYCAPGRAGGGARENFAFVWSDEGPVMFADGGGKSAPVVISLWESIQQAVRGTTWQDVVGLATGSFGKVVTEFCPEYGEVRFAVSEGGESSNNVIYCLDYQSAVRYAVSGQNPELYPYWRVRKNQIRGWVPCDDLFLVRVDSTGQPSVTGQSRIFGCRDGYVYEYDAPTVYTDEDPVAALGYQSFSMKIRKDGYDGYQDGVREYTKSNRHIFLRTTRANGDITATLYADGGAQHQSQTLNPHGGSGFWGDGSYWGGGGLWTGGEFATTRAELATKGKKFDLEIDDEGNIESDFSINSWSLSGFVEEEM